MEVRGERSEASKSLRTALTSRFELAATGGLVWRGGGIILYSKYDLIDGAAESVESRKAGGYNGRQRHQYLHIWTHNKLIYKTVYFWGYKLYLSLLLSTIIVLQQ